MSDETKTQAPASTAPAQSGQPGQEQPQTTTGVQPQNQNPVQNQGSQGDAPARTVPYEQYQRVLAQVNGSREMVSALQEMGITDPQAVRTAIENAKRYQSLSKQGIPVDRLLDSVQQETKRQAGEQPITEQGLNQLLDKRQATERHNAGTEKAISSLRTIQRELGGEGNDDIVEAEVRQAMGQFLNEQGRRYPAGHPYEGQFMPPDDQDMAKVKEIAQKIIDKKRGFYMRQSVNQPAQPVTGSMGNGQRMNGGEAANMTARDRLTARHHELRQLAEQSLVRPASV